jgi:AbrB family looped-hinge helix DNA binding protein
MGRVTLAANGTRSYLTAILLELTMPRTRLSSKGQVVLPKEIRDRLGWPAGTELDVESEGEAVVLRMRPTRRRTSLDDVIGCIPHDGPPVTLAEMDEAVEQAAREMWDRFEHQRDQG